VAPTQCAAPGGTALLQHVEKRTCAFGLAGATPALRSSIEKDDLAGRGGELLPNAFRRPGIRHGIGARHQRTQVEREKALFLRLSARRHARSLSERPSTNCGLAARRARTISHRLFLSGAQHLDRAADLLVQGPITDQVCPPLRGSREIARLFLERVIPSSAVALSAFRLSGSARLHCDFQALADCARLGLNALQRALLARMVIAILSRSTVRSCRQPCSTIFSACRRAGPFRRQIGLALAACPRTPRHL